MTYFPDLTRYAYGRNSIPGGEDDLNVGWLEAGHVFPTATPGDGLVDALLVCATRAAREYRGLHVCDLCPRIGSFADLVVTMTVDGRRVLLGNGEVRVHASDGSWYAAPTLVAHYVAEHHYAPPTPFVDAVIARAKTLYILAGEQRRRLHALSAEQQLSLLLRVVAAMPTAHPGERDRVYARIRGSAVDQPDSTWCSSWNGEIPPELAVLEEPIAQACWSINLTFSRGEQIDAGRREGIRNDCVTRVLECAADLGVDATAFTGSDAGDG